MRRPTPRFSVLTVLLGTCLSAEFRIPIHEHHKPGQQNFATSPQLEVGDRHKNYNHDVDRVYPFELGAGHYYQFDIMLKPDAQRTTRSAIPLKPNATQARWPNGVVPYVIDGDYTPSEINNIHAAIQQFTENTCVRFVPRTNESLFLSIVDGPSGCWSYVGQSLDNTYNLVNLQRPSCMNTATIAHELMHSLGFFHEFIRPDRDAWVSVDMTALAPQFQTTAFYNANYAALGYDQTELYDVPYNYGSVMHYSKWAGAYNFSKPVMNNLKPWTGDFGNSIGLAGTDIRAINLMYCT